MRASRLFIALAAFAVICLMTLTTAQMRVGPAFSASTNSPPVAVDDNYTVHGSLVLNILANDSDPDGDTVIFDGLAVGPSHGVLTSPSPGQFRYIANNGYVGPDSFTYVIRDRFFASSSANVTINVVNQTPLANPDAAIVRGILVLTPFLNDSDPDGDPFIFDSIATPPQHGTIVGVNPGEFKYTANAGYVGSDSFTYRVRDSLFAYAIGTVTLYVIGDGENNGPCPCHGRIGEPVNVTNGNMYLQQGDYALPSVGPGINITRTYNSNSQRFGLFGRGWSSEYDESIVAYDGNLARLNRPDGRAIYLARPIGSSGAFAPLEEDFPGSLVQNGGGSSTVTTTNGSVRQFNSSGKLTSLNDRVGNQTTLAYDSGGKLTSVTDPFGRMLSFTTNTNGQVLSISDSMGIVATYNYGDSNQLLSVTYADNSAFQFAYDANNRLTAVTDALGNIIESHTYDGQGRAITSERHGGVEHYSLSYVSDTETQVTDALSHVTKHTIDKSKGRNVVTRVEGVCNCGGGGSQVRTWTYDSQLNVIAKTDALNHVVTYSYDANGNLLSETDSLGTATYTYNGFAEVLTATDKLNGVTTNNYDSSGNLLTTKDALNNTTAFTYNARGQILTATDARGKMTSFTYDGVGNLTQSRDANGITTFYFYDARSRLTKVRDALSRSSLAAYDAAGRVKKVTHADLSFVIFNYDLAGRRTSVIDEKGNATSYAYDGAYRLTAVTDALSHATTYAYDAMSNLTSTTDALGRVTNFEYDDFNRLKKIIYPPASTGAMRLFSLLAYDAAGNVVQRKDTAGRVTNYSYDNVNRLANTTDADNKSTSFEYDALSHTTALTDALNQRYQFAYDAVGRQTQVTRAGTSMSYAYDAVGNLTQRTDYNGTVTNYAYDNLNRLTTIAYPTRNATFAYDPLNNLTRATNENGSVYLSYDNRYRLSTVSDPFYYGVSYNYDAAGNRTKLSLNYSTYASYTYDAVNRLTNLKDSANQSFPHSYDAANRLTSRGAPNGVTSSYAYDGLDRLTALAHAAGPTTLIGNQYQYNDAHNISSWTNGSGSHAYGYDLVDRLTSATNSASPNENYSYDSVGNRTVSHLSASYSYQPFNKLASTATGTYAYDANGNLLTKTDSLGTTTFTWNEENQLTQVALPTGLTVSYKYDALGRRIQRTTTAGANERYVYDGNDVLLDLNADWSVATTYLNAPGIDNHLRQTNSATGVSYFLTDHLGSTAGLTDGAGNLLEQQAYDSFGNSTGSARTRYGYTGRERDPDTGLMYYRARWYDPQVGRFISEDPIGLTGGINSFTYVSNNPQNATDPSGLFEIDVHYYLTYFLAMKTGCFTDAEADEIAKADQGVDDNPKTAPGPGTTKRQRQVNAFYHALHSGSHLPYLQTHWTMATMGKRGSLVGLGIYLHYRQDMFSHQGYTNSAWGHATGFHAVDKTNADVAKAMRMARATWDALNEFASEKKCGCRGKIEDWWWKQVEDFARAPTGGFYDKRANSIEQMDPWFLNNKISILAVTRRYRPD